MHILYVITVSSGHPIPAMITLKDTNHAPIVIAFTLRTNLQVKKEKKVGTGRQASKRRQIIGLKTHSFCTCKARAAKEKVQEGNMFSNGPMEGLQLFFSCHAQHASSFWASVS